MVVRTIRTSYEESNRIADDKQTCIFRDEKEGYRVNDVFNFQCYKDGRPVTHRNNNCGYVVTMIQDHKLAPVEPGFVLINFRRISK